MTSERPGDAHGPFHNVADYVRQDGYIYVWSESNVRYTLIGKANFSTPAGRRVLPGPLDRESGTVEGVAPVDFFQLNRELSS